MIREYFIEWFLEQVSNSQKLCINVRHSFIWMTINTEKFLVAILTKIQRGSILIIFMDIPGFKGLTLFDILCSYYGVSLGFYVGICNQCNYGYNKG